MSTVMKVYVVYRNDCMVDVCSSYRAACLMVGHYKKLDRIVGIKMKYYTLCWSVWKEDKVKLFRRFYNYENNSAISKCQK